MMETIKVEVKDSSSPAPTDEERKQSEVKRKLRKRSMESDHSCYNHREEDQTSEELQIASEQTQLGELA